MKFQIPFGGKTVNVGKRLVSVSEGLFETEDKELIKALNGAKNVTVEVQLKPSIKTKK